jgi:hypothetical protein
MRCCGLAIGLGVGCLIGWAESGPAPGLAGIEAEKGAVHLFLLAGQSNMAGRGEMTPDRREPIPGVMALQQDGSWGPAVDPLHWDKSSAGVGLARSFAQAYRQDHPNVTVGFIPAAAGGSPIEAWVEGEYFVPTKGYLWDDAVARTKAVLVRGELKGVLWHQGEADSTPDRVTEYEARLKSLVAELRSVFGRPNLPFLIGQLGQFEGAEWSAARQQVDQIHQRIAAEDSWVGFISAQGLTAKADLLHFDAAGQDELGRRYAAEFAALVKN